MEFLEEIAKDIRKIEEDGGTARIIVISRNFWDYTKQSKEFRDRLEYIFPNIDNLEMVHGCKLIVMSGGLILFDNQRKPWVVIGS